VIRIGSFSKTLSASFRCGYIAARPDWIDKLMDLRIATGFASSRLTEELVFAVLGSSGYRKYLDALRARLAKAMTPTVARLESLGIKPWVMPKAGMLVWCRLPHGLDAADVARHALSEGVVLAPGDVFSASHTASGFMRLNVAQCADDRTFAVIEKAMRQAG
uniref:aminotransferase class I/II-fold pyridoxal phosphate-dependent enzyme n=1 Tax=Microvirga sp. Mcv34 TaxID=2926016 RepID=UPI0021C930DA